MTTRFTLDDWGDEELDLSIIAFVSHLPNYRFAYTLNKNLNTQFEERIEPISVNTNKEKTSYCVFEARAEYKNNVINLLLIDNISHHNDREKASLGMFDDIHQEVRFHSRGKHQWNYLVISNDLNYTDNILSKLTTSLIIASQRVDFKDLKKDRQHILKDLYYENER